MLGIGGGMAGIGADGAATFTFTGGGGGIGCAIGTPACAGPEGPKIDRLTAGAAKDATTPGRNPARIAGIGARMLKAASKGFFSPRRTAGASIAPMRYVGYLTHLSSHIARSPPGSKTLL